MEPRYFVKFRQPCPCGEGSDNTGINNDGSAKCFNCSKFFIDYEASTEGIDITQKEEKPKREILSLGQFDDIPERKLSRNTCQAYNVKVIKGNEGIVRHIYPLYDEEDNEVAQKIRNCADKSFDIRGDFKRATLFGQSLFKAGSARYITVTEGELDAMAAYQMTGSKYPCVSIRSGSSGASKDFKAQMEYLESFDNVVICFDQDSAGKEAVKSVCKLLTPGKVKIMSMPLKDASDMLVSNRSGEFLQCFWDSEKYIPSGIVNVSKNKDKFLKSIKELKEISFIPYPWKGLNIKLDGINLGTLITLTAGAGLGKTAVTRELEEHLLNITDFNVGIMALEENETQTTLGLMSVKAGVPLFRKHILAEYPEAKLEQLHETTFGGDREDRVHIHSHLGIQTIEDIFAKLRFLMVGCDCKIVIFDHLHMLIASHGGSDERIVIDEIMVRLRSLIEETGTTLILVSHLRRAMGDKGHEQGVEVSLSHLRGSQSIAQVSDVVIALERNQQAEDDRDANTTTVRVLKSRHTGETGIACKLYFDRHSGRLEELGEELEFDEFK